jgi:amidase
VSTRVPPGVPGRPDASVVAAVEETASLLSALGHEVSRHDPQTTQAMARRVVVRYLAGAAEEARAVDHPERLEPRTRRMARAGRTAERLLARARAHEAADAARLTALLRDHDVLLTPTVAVPAPRIGAWEGRGALATWLGNVAAFPFTAAWNHAGVPAASVPAGRDAAGLPRAVQLVGPPGGEPLLLSLSRQLEEARPWTHDRPPVS